MATTPSGQEARRPRLTATRGTQNGRVRKHRAALEAEEVRGDLAMGLANCSQRPRDLERPIVMRPGWRGCILCGLQADWLRCVLLHFSQTPLAVANDTVIGHFLSASPRPQSGAASTSSGPAARPGQSLHRPRWTRVATLIKQHIPSREGWRRRRVLWTSMLSSVFCLSVHPFTCMHSSFLSSAQT